MRKLSFLVILLVGLLAFNGMAFAWGTTGGDGADYGQLQETAVFFNNDGSTLHVGEVVVIDRTGTGVTAGTTLGAYVHKTPAGATGTDSIEVAGIVKHEAINQSPVILVTRGPVQANSIDSTDAVTTGAGVGTSITTGAIGGGSGVGYALEAGDGTDGDSIWIWVNPESR